MSEITVTLPDGSKEQYPSGITASEVALNISRRLAEAALAAKIDDKLVDLNVKLEKDAKLEIVTFDSEEGKEVYRHTASHAMAQAVKKLFPEAKLTIGPPIESGFYYDFDTPRPFVPEDLEQIEAEMQKIIDADLPISRHEVSKDEAIKIFQERGEDYKVEMLHEMPDEIVSLYQQGNFIDLCLGPHLPSTGKLKAVKLLSIAGAYWRGDEKRQMLQRIYGIAYDNKADLEKHLKRIEEAEKRDHRKLGRELDFFSLHEEEAGPGLVYWHPKGTTVRRIVEDFWKDEHIKRGYQLVTIPHIAKSDLWHTSGHYDFYRENMYTMNIDTQEYVLKPMNCPGHILIYKTKTRSYRELPIRYAELGTVYRYERTGVLHGMFRVRGFTQDDAHIFCTPEQLPAEIIGVIDLVDYMLRSFGYERYEVELSVRDPENKDKYMGSDEEWERAENALIDALNQRGLSYKRMEGEAVFYGPKIDIKLVDALGHSWQGPTIQFDFNLPGRFDVKYVGADGNEHQVVMVHRTVLGSMERFIGGLIEFYNGALPLWLSPVQARILSITDEQIEYAKQVENQLKEAGLRTEADVRNEKLGFKIREAQLEKIPYMLVVGNREAAAGQVAVRLRSGEDLGPMDVADFIKRATDEVLEKSFSDVKKDG
ncbi:MAG: threonine--tRNA ligase [Candidatus Poribacteria bacterium]